MSNAPIFETSLWTRVKAYGVHVYTALGFVCSLLALRSIFASDYRGAYLWLIVAFVIDASDGTLARRFGTKKYAGRIDGRKLDDIVDYLNYTFIPIVLLVHAGWIPEPVWLWASLPLLGSGFAFSNVGAKEEDNGFFLGFPSYWNVFAFYTDVCFRYLGTGVIVGAIVLLSVLSVLPVRFVYPSHAPRWKRLFVAGGLVWFGLVCAVLLQYDPAGGPDPYLVGASLAYPMLYIVLSFYLDIRLPRAKHE